MDHAARLAEIARLRGEIAAGSRAVASVHCQLARHLEELGRLDEALVVYRDAADIVEAQELPYFTYAMTRQLMRLTPNDRAFRARHERAIRALARIGIACGPHAEDAPRRQGAGTDVVSIVSTIDRTYRDQLVRCSMTLLSDGRSIRVVLRHEGSKSGPIGTPWLEAASYAIEIADGGCPIAVAAEVVDAQEFVHELRLACIDPEAHARIRSNPVTERSNIAALLLDTGVGDPHRVYNVYVDAAFAPHSNTTGT